VHAGKIHRFVDIAFRGGAIAEQAGGMQDRVGSALMRVRCALQVCRDRSTRSWERRSEGGGPVVCSIFETAWLMRARVAGRPTSGTMKAPARIGRGTARGRGLHPAETSLTALAVPLQGIA
jgi:hypothetical protein